MTRRTVIVATSVGFVVVGGLMYVRSLSRPSFQKPGRSDEVAAGYAALTQRPASTEQIPRQSLNREQIATEVTRRDKSDKTWEWKIPIQFFGLVVDENNQPVPDADVHFQWTDISAKGTADADAKTDEKGLFLLEGVQGKRLGVRIAKPGYYSSDSRNQWSFEYANPYEEVFYEPRQETPVVFHLRKQRASADVVSRSTEVKLEGYGSQTRVRLDNGKPGAEGELVIQAWKPWPPRPMSPPYDWKVVLQLDGGGFANAPDEFAFEAPETGYDPVYTVDMRAALTAEWKVSVERTLYFTVGHPKKYGRLSLRTDGNSRYVFLDYVINSAGGRNLEADPASTK